MSSDSPELGTGGIWMNNPDAVVPHFGSPAPQAQGLLGPNGQPIDRKDPK